VTDLPASSENSFGAHQIDVTPEMLDAGKRALERILGDNYSGHWDSYDIVSSVVGAALSAHPGSCLPKSKSV
jgi:hypothetical protein